MAKITNERAERVAKSHPCFHCGEYSYKRVRVTPATAAQRKELKVAWQAAMTCGICGSEQEIGISDAGDIVY